MKLPRSKQLPIASLAALICVALILPNTSTRAFAAPAEPIPDSEAAPAIALGNALASVAAHSKGFVVSVLSEKVLKFRNKGLPFPFGNPFFHGFFGPPGAMPHSNGIPVQGLGSGFILDEHGHVLTNNHVVAGMSRIRVVLPNKESFPARVLGSDPKTDLAVVQIDGNYPKNLPAARLGDSDSLKPGNLVMAFGAPFGLTHTVTSGIVSATGRSRVGIADYEDFIQTDAPINPGNSGGPLLDMKGNVVGINTAIITGVGQSAGVGFAIPINMAREILPTLLQGKPVIRGMLGVGVQDLTPPLDQEFATSGTKGALVAQVNSGSPAQKAGLRAGDVIVRYAGQPIADSTQLRDFVSRTVPGSHENITVLRDGKPVTLEAKIGELGVQSAGQAPVPKSVPRKSSLQRFGIQGKTLTQDQSAEYQTHQTSGIVITSVNPSSAAAMAGLAPGDVITQVNRKDVRSLKQADQIMARTRTPDLIVLLVHHHGTALYVSLETG